MNKPNFEILLTKFNQVMEEETEIISKLKNRLAKLEAEKVPYNSSSVDLLGRNMKMLIPGPTYFPGDLTRKPGSVIGRHLESPLLINADSVLASVPVRGLSKVSH